MGISERLMTLRIQLSPTRHATLISAYAPTMTSALETKNAFYDLLDETLRLIPSSDKIILLGDFNARVGSDSEVYAGIVGRHGVGKVNENGKRLLNLCAAHRLAISNTMFQMANKFKTSWMHPRSKSWHLIDYVIVRQSDMRDVVITRALRGAECWTDHRLIRSIMRLQVALPHRKLSRQKRINVRALQSEENSKTFKHKVAEMLCSKSDSPSSFQTIHNLTDDWTSLSTALLEVAASTVGYTRHKSNDWFDENSAEIRDLLDKKRAAHIAALNNPSSETLRSRYASLRSQVQSSLHRMKNDWWQNKAKEIQEYADNHDPRNFYNSIKAVFGPAKGRNVPVLSADGTTLIKNKQEILKRWSEHFSELLNRINPADYDIINQLPSLPPVSELDNEPSLVEVLAAIKDLKNNKAPGPDGIPGEIFKYGGHLLAQRLHKFICDAWNAEKLPQQWKDANIVTIYKRKGDKSKCGNYRGISLLAVGGKVLARVMLARLLATVVNMVLPETQCGFRKERSTTDMIFVARLLQEKCREQHKHLYAAFVDLTKAFDTVNRNMLWSILAKCGCPPKFVAVIKEFHSGMTARVVVDGVKSEPFEVSVGVKQGCVLAPLLFNIYLVAVSLLSRHSFNPDDGIGYKYRLDGNIFNLRRLKSVNKTRHDLIFDLQYADDVVFVSHTSEGLQRILNSAENVYRSTGLVINCNKTEVLCQGYDTNDHSPTFQLGENELRNVDKFTYLGSVLSSSCKLDDEIENRICRSNRAFGSLSRRVFRNRGINLKTKVAVYKAVCLSSLVYGCETWTPCRAHIRSLESFHIRCLQRMLGITWKDRIPHTEILKRTGCVSIEALIIKQLLRWVGHVVRMPENRLPRKFLYGELAEGHRSQGGQKRRFKDHLKSALKQCEISSVELESLANDRAEWRHICQHGIEKFEASRVRSKETRREKRHEKKNQPQTTANAAISCPDCGKLCASELGLRSHMRIHKNSNH